MRLRTQRHVLAVVLTSSAVVALSLIVAANGFRDFDSVLWLFDVASVAALVYSLTILVSRAMAFEVEIWKRSAAFATLSGAVLTILVFARVSELNVSGVGVAVVLTGALGAALGLMTVEGLRWVRNAAPPSRAA